MHYKFIFVVSLLSSGLRLQTGHNLTFLPQLQELCPYSTFCEVNASSNFLGNDSDRPCCSSCSCKPGCEVYDNCCFDLDNAKIFRKCTSSVVSYINTPATKYVMIHSCVPNQHQQIDGNITMCEVNETDFKSFAPVTSTLTGDTYVNADCAFCNKIHDIIPWKLSVSCAEGIEDHAFNTLQLLHGKDFKKTGCHLSYIPPTITDLAPTTCVTEAIRECNVTGRAMKWEPFWDYCPMFNATYAINFKTVYGNIFCYMCNKYDSAKNKQLCSNSDYKYPTRVPFTAILEGLSIDEFDVITANDRKDKCGPTEALVHSFTTECRPVLCPWGQFRLGYKCAYYSKEWIGGPFTAVLKLTPLAWTQPIDISVLSDILPGLKYDTKAKWLKRKAMAAWNVETLYKPSADRKYVEYLVAIATYPGSIVNPSRLRTVLRQTLEETWQLIAGNNSFQLQVEFDRFAHYSKRPKDSLPSDCLETFMEDYVFVNTLIHSWVCEDNNLLEVYCHHEVYQTSTKSTLNELFLCDQIELRLDEFQHLSGNFLFKVTNETLYKPEYRTTPSGSYSICLNRFNQNSTSWNAVVSALSDTYAYQNVVYIGLLLVFVFN